EQYVETPGDVRAGRVWEFLVLVAVPVQALVLLGWWMYQATTTGFVGETGRWWDPLNPYSLMTCLVQWGLALAVLILLNRHVMHRTLGAATSPAVEDDPYPPSLP
ncbi:MAG TPA: hypothetical protein VD948_09200, partial [Rhodothermales bacterium]|nr:hypothetical protein [Rhodothermales bacterium]